jgi:hypothetical protein
MDEVKEPGPIPEFFKQAKSKLAYQELEKAYFGAFDMAQSLGLPLGFAIAQMKDILHKEEDGEKRLDYQIDYMFRRWQMIRGII